MGSVSFNGVSNLGKGNSIMPRYSTQDKIEILKEIKKQKQIDEFKRVLMNKSSSL